MSGMVTVIGATRLDDLEVVVEPKELPELLVLDMLLPLAVIEAKEAERELRSVGRGAPQGRFPENEVVRRDGTPNAVCGRVRALSISCGNAGSVLEMSSGSTLESTTRRTSRAAWTPSWPSGLTARRERVNSGIAVGEWKGVGDGARREAVIAEVGRANVGGRGEKGCCIGGSRDVMRPSAECVATMLNDSQGPAEAEFPPPPPQKNPSACSAIRVVHVVAKEYCYSSFWPKTRMQWEIALHPAARAVPLKTRTARPLFTPFFTPFVMGHERDKKILCHPEFVRTPHDGARLRPSIRPRAVHNPKIEQARVNGTRVAIDIQSHGGGPLPFKAIQTAAAPSGSAIAAQY